MRQGLLRQWQRLLRRLGTSGMVGLALLLIAGVLIAWTPSLLRDANDQRAVAEQRQRATAMLIRTRGELPSTRQQLIRFVASFPMIGQNAADLKVVFAAAERHRIALPKGEYVLNAEPHSTFVVYTATFPVAEGYGGIKEFAAEVLSTLPHSAMEDLRLERRDSLSTGLDARIRISLIYRGS